MKAAALAMEELSAIEDLLEGRRRGGTLVHYSFAAAAGAAYGLLVEYFSLTGIGAGALYCAALWFGADFVLLPLAGFSNSAPAYSWRVEGLALAGHLAYGAVLETAHKRIRAAL